MDAKYKGLTHCEQIDLYCKDVLSGKIPAGELVKLACKRHLSDLGRTQQEDYPFIYDEKAVDKFCTFAELMVFVEGKWAGKPVRLEPWQKFAFASKFGWKKKSDGMRRFTESFVEVTRKNAKSTIEAIQSLYMLSADGENGAQCFNGATGKDQAMIVFRIAKLMVDRNPKFAKALGITTTKECIFCNRTSSFLRPIIGKPGDGSNPHYASCDEYHEHPTADLFDTMQTGMGSRSQPLLSVITTAGFNISGPCYQKLKEVEKMLHGTIENEHLFAVVYSLDAGDDWTDFSCWPKANPNYGVSVYEDYLFKQYQSAMREASKQNTIKTKHLDLWCNASLSWINMARWRDCEDSTLKLEDFRGEDCWMGVDLASKVDLTSAAIVFRREDKYYLFCKHYINRERADLPENEHYRRWAADGYMTITEGASTDFRIFMRDLFGKSIRAELNELPDWRYYFESDDCPDEGIEDIANIQELAYDPRESEFMMQTIRTYASYDCVEFPQSPVFISEPAKELEALYLDGKLIHAPDPVLDWCFSNVVLKQSKSKAYYPTKDVDANKIDAVMASIMALSRAMKASDTAPWLMFV